ncbi:MAG: proton-conducting transporter membrane subunit [Caldilineaceae bacterium]
MGRCGLASYLLIGFYFDREDETYGAYADAGKKAFLVNRVGDFGMMLAIFAIWTSLGTAIPRSVGEHRTHVAPGAPLTFIDLMLLLAATGKSAQLPLFVWLPDAHGRPHASVGADSCGDDGHCGHLRRSPAPASSGKRRAGIEHRGLGRRADGAAGCVDCGGANWISRRSGLFHDFAAWPHDAGCGCGGVRLRHLPPGDTHAFFKALLFWPRAT